MSSWQWKVLPRITTSSIGRSLLRLLGRLLTGRVGGCVLYAQLLDETRCTCHFISWVCTGHLFKYTAWVCLGVYTLKSMYSYHNMGIILHEPRSFCWPILYIIRIEIKNCVTDCLTDLVTCSGYLRVAVFPSIQITASKITSIEIQYSI